MVSVLQTTVLCDRDLGHNIEVLLLGPYQPRLTVILCNIKDCDTAAVILTTFYNTLLEAYAKCITNHGIM